MKYIIFKQFNEEVPVLFPSTIQHKAMANNLKFMKPVAAGFVRPDSFGIGVACYGDSLTLNLASRQIDTVIVNKFLGLE